MKIRPLGAELFHGDGQNRQTGMAKLIVTFFNFSKALKNPYISCDRRFVYGLPIAIKIY